jgi:glycyl-tRNA synthetase beta chain
VTSFAQLTGLLRDHFVLLDVEERKKRVHGFVSRLKVNGGKGLEREWVELAEYPTVVTGLFPEHFKQTLPIDLRATVLQHHQKYMSVGKAGFAALTDIDEPAAARAVRGMERVVLARFRDAAFFLAEDQRRRLEDRVADLKEVTYHQKLGSYHDKMERMVRQVASMGDHGWLQGADRDSAHRAARLAKADLTTLMVGEFPELQGTMGAFYLGEQQEGQDGPKEPAEVLRAIRFHWGPAGVRAEDAPPRSDVGRGPVFGSVALADKLDTLAGYFLLGLEPRGSSDPFGLRRAGQGIVRVLLDYWPGPPAVDLGALVPVALEGYAGLAPGRGKDGTLSPEEAARALSAFLEARLAYVLTARECPNDVVDAVLRAPGRPPLRDLKGCWDRAEALKRVRAEAPEDFAALAQAFKRASNILDGQAPASTVDEALFEAPAERALLAAVQKRAGREGSHEERLRALAGLRGPVAGFFDDVLVMAEDPAVRGNRLALLARARDLFFDIADVSRLGG